MAANASSITVPPGKLLDSRSFLFLPLPRHLSFRTRTQEEDVPPPPRAAPNSCCPAVAHISHKQTTNDWREGWEQQQTPTIHSLSSLPPILLKFFSSFVFPTLFSVDYYYCFFFSHCLSTDDMGGGMGELDEVQTRFGITIYLPSGHSSTDSRGAVGQIRSFWPPKTHGLRSVEINPSPSIVCFIHRDVVVDVADVDYIIYFRLLLIRWWCEVEGHLWHYLQQQPNSRTARWDRYWSRRGMAHLANYVLVRTAAGKRGSPRHRRWHARCCKMASILSFFVGPLFIYLLGFPPLTIKTATASSFCWFVINYRSIDVVLGLWIVCFRIVNV